MFPNLHCAGSEVTLHAALRAMVARGHGVTVIADRTPEPYEIDGIKVLSLPRYGTHERVREIAKDADILVTHLDCTSLAMTLSIDLDKPLVHFIHNDAQLKYWNVNPYAFGKAALVIFNSKAIAEKEKYKDEPWPGPQITIHPIVEPERYKCKPGTKITLCNPTDGKGISTLHKLSEAMPDYEFLVVEGIYGEQIAPPNLGDDWVAAHPNVEHMKNDPDFRNVLRKTKVLLMPSNYESYGRCAVEAACAGIPSIVHPTEGLLESLNAERTPAPEELQGGWVSGAGIFCDRADIPSWKAQIERLYSDEVYYRSRVDAAVKLMNSLDPESEFDRLEEALQHTLERWSGREAGDVSKKFTSDRRLWRMKDGSIKEEVNGRISPDAVSLFAGVGSEIPEEIARELGLIPETKAIEAPAENKAIQAPQENKARGRKKTA